MNSPQPSSINVKQLQTGGFDHNFSYLLLHAGGDAALIDPCGDLQIIETAVKAAGPLQPRYILLTHGHHDHTSGVKAVKRFFSAPTLAHPACAFPHERHLRDRELLPLGNLAIEALFTPGHSTDSVCYHLSDDSAIFTGDTLFIDWCGHCRPEAMFKTMRETLFPLSDSNLVFSGHDYGHAPFAPLGDEKRGNLYLRATDFKEFLAALKQL